MPWLAAVGAVAAAGIGAASSASDRAKSLSENQKAVQAWLDVNIPDPKAQKLALQRYVQAGELSPEMEEAVKRGPTNLEQIRVDPRYKEAQLRSLKSLSDLGSEGLSFADEAELADLNNDVNAQARGRVGALRDSAAARGVGGSGVTLALEQDAAQNAQAQQAKAGRDKFAMSRQRALDAILKSGTLAGDLRSSDYGEQKDLAQGRDAIDDFNAKMLAGTRQRNTDRTNNARQVNLTNRQDIANKNTTLSNEETKWNDIDRYQQRFDNETKVASGKANAYSGNANAYQNSANQTAGMWAGVGQGAVKVGTALANQKSDPEPYEDDYGDDESGWW